MSTQIAAALDTMAGLTESFTVNVPPAEFQDWLTSLGLTEFWVNRREGSLGVHAHQAGYHHGVYVQVHAMAATIDGHEVPDLDAKPWYLTLPTAEAVKLLAAESGASDSSAVTR